MYSCTLILFLYYLSFLHLWIHRSPLDWFVAPSLLARSAPTPPPAAATGREISAVVPSLDFYTERLTQMGRRPWNGSRYLVFFFFFFLFCQNIIWWEGGNKIPCTNFLAQTTQTLRTVVQNQMGRLCVLQLQLLKIEMFFIHSVHSSRVLVNCNQNDRTSRKQEAGSCSSCVLYVQVQFCSRCCNRLCFHETVLTPPVLSSPASCRVIRITPLSSSPLSPLQTW